jgi:hypothetical protein
MRMRSDWSEARGESGTSLTFAGIDQDAQDALDAENFARGVTAPSAEDPGGKAFAGWRTRALTPEDGMRLGLALLCMVLAGVFLLPENPSDRTVIVVLGGAFVFGIALPSVVNLVRARRAKPVLRSTRDTFTLEVGPQGLVLRSQSGMARTFALASVDHFEGGRRLVVRLRDATSEALPCVLPSRAHDGLADRLNELVAEERARSGGYR